MIIIINNLVPLKWTPNKRMEETLVMSHVLFRHGNKLLDNTHTYPNDPHGNVDLFPFRKGDLSLEGKKNSYKLGEELRQHYAKFLGPTYYSGIVDATSAGTPRNEMTLLCVLASLFPTDTENNLKDGINWQPILYKKLDLREDGLISIFGKYSPMFRPRFIEVDEETQKVFDYLEEKMGRGINDCAFHIYHIFKLQLEHNLPLPEWAQPIWPEPLGKLAMDWLSALIEKFLKLFLEKYIDKVIADTRKTLISTEQYKTKLFLYSAHDTNITALLNLIKFPDYLKEINYCSCFNLEVHLINGVYGFKVLHRNGQNEEFRYLPIFDAGEFISLDKFEELAKARFNSQRFDSNL